MVVVGDENVTFYVVVPLVRLAMAKYIYFISAIIVPPRVHVVLK
jgi:hypothetical protein